MHNSPFPSDNEKAPVGDQPQYPFSNSTPQQPVQASVVPPIVPVATPVTSTIPHAPAVAVGRFSDGLGLIWTGLVLNLTGFYPLIVLLMTLDDPRHMNTMGAWLLISPALFTGTILSGFGVKEKGYQKDTMRYFGIASFAVGVFFFFVPVIASVLYGLGIGN